MIRVKRAYALPAAEDGSRFLVDGLWPRGIRKEHLQIDGWLKEVAPSAGLRTWFGHDPDRWAEFQVRYFSELEDKQEALKPIRAAARQGTVTLVYGARDEEHNNAVALKRYLEQTPDPADATGSTHPVGEGGLAVNEGGDSLHPIVRQAIAVERKARAFYLEAADRATSSLGAEMFRSLAAEEARHERILGRHLQALVQGRALPEGTDLVRVDLLSTFFPEGGETLQAHVPLDASDLDALLFAMGLENDSLNLYRELASSARDPVSQRVFEYLAGEDRAHLDLLMLNYEYISRVGWWSRQDPA